MSKNLPVTSLGLTKMFSTDFFGKQPLSNLNKNSRKFHGKVHSGWKCRVEASNFQFTDVCLKQVLNVLNVEKISGGLYF